MAHPAPSLEKPAKAREPSELPPRSAQFKRNTPDLKVAAETAASTPPQGQDAEPARPRPGMGPSTSSLHLSHHRAMNEPPCPVGGGGGGWRAGPHTTPALRSPESAIVEWGWLGHGLAGYLLLLQASLAGSGPTSVSCVLSLLLPGTGRGRGGWRGLGRARASPRVGGREGEGPRTGLREVGGGGSGHCGGEGPSPAPLDGGPAAGSGSLSTSERAKRRGRGASGRVGVSSVDGVGVGVAGTTDSRGPPPPGAGKDRRGEAAGGRSSEAEPSGKPVWRGGKEPPGPRAPGGQVDLTFGAGVPEAPNPRRQETPSFQQGPAPRLAGRVRGGAAADHAPLQVARGQVGRVCLHPGPSFALPAAQGRAGARKSPCGQSGRDDGVPRAPGAPKLQLRKQEAEISLFMTWQRQFNISSSHKIGIALFT
ncbi:collagen alpha-1(I) chain-like [Bos javanicus]|uniref:collagen alpha-1(I) chain-like n=1 Tax=Bos javanicus TaxID=9906 RepID=UPI002AA91A20|nr:collagen alpha-1(I) chain-like [Bos javanicus]